MIIYALYIESRYPQKLIGHLQKERGYTVAETSAGIYTVSGDILPIQIIDSRRLSAQENLWLKSLSDELGHEAITRVGDEITRQGKAARIAAYLNAIMLANPITMKEAIEMDNTSTIDRILIETGLVAKWEARAEERKAFGIAQNMVKMGLPVETVVSATQLDPEKVKALYLTGD